MGYNFVICGVTLPMRIIRTMQLALENLRSERLELVGSGVSFQEYMRIVDLDRWSAIETRFDVARISHQVASEGVEMAELPLASQA